MPPMLGECSPSKLDPLSPLTPVPVPLPALADANMGIGRVDPGMRDMPLPPGTPAYWPGKGTLSSVPYSAP